MSRKILERPAVVVARMKKPGLHFVGGVPGLALQVTATGARSWILRVTIAGKRRDMGLGSFPDVSLAIARQAARDARAKISMGRDPIEESRAARGELAESRASAVSFERAATLYVEAHESAWRGAKHAVQWRTVMEAYAYPVIGALNVEAVKLPHVMQVLEPIWRTKTQTASRLRGRIESVLDWAAARGYRQGPNPSRWRGLLDKLLPAPAKVAKPDHHAALAVSEVGEFMQLVRVQPGLGARALEFTVLTAVRSGEALRASWSEIDFDAAVWTIPAGRMKAGREHRVPLSQACIELLRKLEEVRLSPWVFPGRLVGRPLETNACFSVLRRMSRSDITVHGFRSTFRDWCAERTTYPNEVAEMALAHTLSNKVEAAYRRGDLIDKRRQMMEDWAAFCAKPQSNAEVIAIKAAAA
jgi:integrase